MQLREAGARPTPPSPQVPRHAAPVLAGRYQLGRTLGIGGSAAVYQAVDLTLNRTVAVKVSRGLAMDEAHALRAAEEARLLATLDHPSIPPLYDAGVADGRSYLVTPLIDGPTLTERIRHEQMNSAEAQWLGIALADALCHVHGRGIVHRDVKPDNILLPPGGGLRLVDFGIARASDSPALTAESLVVGTAGYLAPERIRGATAAPAADVYSLGLTLLEALVGRRTYDGTALQQAMAAIDRPPVIPAALGPRWCSLLTALTESNPRRRPTMSDTRDHLASWYHTTGGQHTAIQQPARIHRGQRKQPYASAVSRSAQATELMRTIF